MHHLVIVPVRVDDREVRAAQLWDLGATGIEERPDELRAGFDDRATALAARAAIGSGRVEAVAPGSGLDAGRAHLDVVRVGTIAVHPPWRAPPPDTVAISIDPGHSFGSGSHPSTRLALALLSETLLRWDTRDGPPTVLDVGCGSGVLALTAVALGASVVAIDVDPAARAATLANAAANDVRVGDDGPLVVGAGPVADHPGPVDLAVVNVTVDIHERLGPEVAQRTDLVVVAGVLVGHQEARVARAYRARSWRRMTEGDWAAAVLRRRRG